MDKKTGYGKYVNVAYCLAKLGLKVTLVCMADKMGLDMLMQRFSSIRSGINLCIKNGKQGFNIAFEFLDETSKVNMSDIRDNDRFGSDMFSSVDDLKALEDAAAVALVDWSSNSLGTELAEHVFANSTRALHFIDPGDARKKKRYPIFA